jgi:hypothetical protein
VRGFVLRGLAVGTPIAAVAIVAALTLDPVPSRAIHARIARRVRALEDQGERMGRDFTVSADGLHVYSVCR